MKRIILLCCCLLLLSCQNNVEQNNVEQKNETLDEPTELVVLNEPNDEEVIVEENNLDVIEPLPSFDLLYSSERGGDRDLYLQTYGQEPNCILDLPSIEGHGDFSPDGFKIVFFSDMDGDRDLYLIDLRDEDITPIQLTDAPKMDHLPDWSPDGQYIVFESNRHGNAEIYVMTADGENQTRLTASKNDDRAPSFSPDGKTIGFTSWVDGMPHFATIPFDLEVLQEVTILTSEYAGYIDWYDTSSIIFHDQTAIYQMNIDGTNRQLILDDDTRTLWVPVYAPDNEWIAYDSEGGVATGEIYLKHINTDTVLQLTDHPSSDWGPDWRPTPQYRNLLFDSDVDGDREIYLKDLNTNKITQLTNNNNDDGLPFWSPDGERIVFFSNRDGDDEIFIMDKNGDNQTQLTFNVYDDRTPSWSHDGLSIAFASMKNGNYDIFSMDTEGKNIIQLTDNGIKEFWPTWAPDDSYITYTAFSTQQDTYKIDLTKDQYPTSLMWSNCSRIEFSPDGKKVAYSSQINGHWDIYLKFLENNRTLPLSHSRSDEWVPTFTPDSMSVVFSRESQYSAAIIQININTYEIKALVGANGQNWRPIYQPLQ